jgi:hypothetical protein
VDQVLVDQVLVESLSNTSAWLAEQGAGFLETVAAGVEPEGILLPQVLVFPLVQPLLLQ